MSDNLPRRIGDNQISRAASDLARDADRLATDAGWYAASVAAGGPASGGAHRLAQGIADLLRQAARLDGMRDIAALLPDEEAL